jgi:hypothetical protein
MAKHTLEIDYDDSQEVGLVYSTNLNNKGLPPDQQLTPDQYLTLQNMNLGTGWAANHTQARTNLGTALYASATPDVQEQVNALIGLQPGAPTGKE